MGNAGIVYSALEYRKFLSALLDGYIPTIVYSKDKIEQAYELKLPEWACVLKFKYKIVRAVKYSKEYEYRLVNIKGVKRKIRELNTREE